MPVITLCNHKGGTGKTTTTINLASAFGLLGYKTLVVDLDPQSFLSEMLRLPAVKEEHTTVAFFGLHESLADIPVVQSRHFDVIPSTPSLTKLLRHLTKPTDVFWMKENIENGHGYDFVLIDTAASLSALTFNALVATDLVIIPVVPEFQSVVGAEQTWQTCLMVRKSLNPTLTEPRFLLTKVDARRRMHQRFQQYLRGQYPKNVLQQMIRTDTLLTERGKEGASVFDIDHQARGALDYANMAEEILHQFGIMPS
ncbi:MAG: ParA family protein [Bacteroidetes Order II. Incertae sedis bacterium]|nr:ParA family protein [Bacteroidetes Order II. bacterium]